MKSLLQVPDRTRLVQIECFWSFNLKNANCWLCFNNKTQVRFIMENVEEVVILRR